MTSPTTIVIVTDSGRLDGGVTQVAVESAVGLAKVGFRVIYFCDLGPPDSRLTATPGIEVVCGGGFDILNNPKRFEAAFNGIFNRRSARALGDLLNDLDPARTVVHLHSWTKALSAEIPRLLSGSGFPHVVTLHEYFRACPNGTFYDFKSGSVCKRVPLGVGCVTCNCDSRSYSHKLWRVARGAIQKWIQLIPGSLENFICVSPFSESILRPFLPRSAYIRMVRYPIMAAPCAPAAPEDHEPFLFVGRFSREKGCLLLAQAANQIGAQVIFVGDGHYRDAIRAELPSAIFTGWLPPADVLAWMRRSRALVFPSTWYETQGLVAIEAASQGLPSILSDCTVAAHDLEHERVGLHFAQGSVAGLAAAMERLRRPALAGELGRAAHGWYWSNPWTREAHIRKLVEIYGDVCERGRG